jgi:beta-glucosidase
MLSLLLVAASALGQQQPWLDPTKSVDERVSLLLAVMTNEEKQAQTIHTTGCTIDECVAAFGATGIGAVPQEGNDGPSIVARRNQYQAALMNNSRLHIPVSFHTETLHGASAGVIFPMPASQGASFNVDLVRSIASVIALEASATGTDRGFSPELNVPTDPRFGRLEENFGEDPALVAALGVAAVEGLHAGNTEGPSSYLPPFAIASEAKHFAAYAFGGKDGMAADVSLRTLHDVYLRPWKAYAEAGGRSAMMAHNSINQQPCHSSAEFMGWLRGQGNMSGALLASDMCDVGLLGPTGFRVAEDLVGAAAPAMGAGLDQELCNPHDGRGQAFTHAADAVAGGALAQAALDRAAANALRPKFAAGLFDGKAFADGSNLGVLDAPEHRALARAAAAEGSVLLKNAGGLLPLTLTPATRVAFVGPNAGCADGSSACDASRSQCGGYTNEGVPVVTVLAAALANNESSFSVTFAQGCAHGGNDTSGFTAAVAVAAAADVVVFVGGDSGGLGWNANTCGEDDDRAELDLPGVQADLLDALLGAGKPVVVVLVHGRPVTFVKHDLMSRVDAVLAVWRPGCEGGNAVWDMLTGRVSPSGRLAQSWVRRVGQVKSQASYVLCVLFFVIGLGVRGAARARV